MTPVDSDLRIKAEAIATAAALDLGEIKLLYSEPLHDVDGNLIFTPDVSFTVNLRSIVPMNWDDLQGMSVNDAVEQLRACSTRDMLHYLYTHQGEPAEPSDLRVVDPMQSP